MPIYPYECQKCGKEHEQERGIASAMKPCPHCKSKKLVRLFPSASLIVPWYNQAVNHNPHPAHSKWVRSDDVQAKLKSGEYCIPNKSERLRD